MTKVECQAIALSARICSSPISILLLLEISTILRTFFGSAVSSAGFIICLLGISKLHHCKKIYLFHQECDAFQKKERVSQPKTGHSTQFIAVVQTSQIFRNILECTISKNILERTISQECPRTHYYFDEIYEAHESSFVCIKPLNK